MNKEELRIGNLVDVNEQIEIVYAIRNSGVDFYRGKTKKSVIMQSYIWEAIKPIPLTEEWHNKFGAKKSGFNSFEYILPETNNLNIKIVFSGDYVFLRQGQGKSYDDDLVSVWNKDLTKREMFVHEWQNLYKSLTNQELTLDR